MEELAKLSAELLQELKATSLGRAKRNRITRIAPARAS
jgi:hypothetical protein